MKILMICDTFIGDKGLKDTVLLKRQLNKFGDPSKNVSQLFLGVKMGS